MVGKNIAKNYELFNNDKTNWYVDIWTVTKYQRRKNINIPYIIYVSQKYLQF